MSRRSRGKLAASVAGVGVLAVLAVALGYREDLIVQYHLYRLRHETGYLWRLDHEALARGGPTLLESRALQRFAATPEWPGAILRESALFSQNALEMPHGKVVVLALDQELYGVRLAWSEKLGEDGIVYEWWTATLKDPARILATGRGETVEQPSEGTIEMGTLSLVWSKGGRNSSWLYWRSDLPALCVSGEVHDRMEDALRAGPGTTWYSKHSVRLAPRS